MKGIILAGGSGTRTTLNLSDKDQKWQSINEIVVFK